MRSHRPPRHRRSVVVALLLGMLGLVLGPATGAGADPHAAVGGPILTVPAEVVFVLGRAGDAYSIEADGDPVPTIGVDRLPPGLRLSAQGDGVATIEGTPLGPVGIMTVEVIAANAAGSSTASITVAVQQAPAFVDRGPLIFTAGRFGSGLVQTVGFPAPGVGAEGDLPRGLDFVDNGDGTATISGTPQDGVTVSPITLTAINVVADASLTTTVQVVLRPEATDGRVGETPGTDARTTGPRREP